MLRVLGKTQDTAVLLATAFVVSSCGAVGVGAQPVSTGASSPPIIFTFESVSGEYIGAGRIATFTPPAASFQLSGNISSASVTVRQGDEDWSIDFAAPVGQNLHKGAYTGAVRAPFQGGNAPGLSVYGDGRGCSNSYGSFVIKQITTNTLGDLTTLDATFVQHCESMTAPALRGSVRYLTLSGTGG